MTAQAAAAATEVEPRVARVSFIEGEASYLNADADEWTAVDVNAPLVTGDRFYSGADGRAEIELPGGVYARLSSATELDLLEVSDQAVHVRVGIGTATFRLRSVPAGEHVEISTPTTAVVVRARGVYRVDVAEDGQTTVLVREGEADAFLGDQRYRLEQGRGARIVDASYVEGNDGAAQPLEVFDASSIQNDPWDDWERSRATRAQSSPSAQYVAHDVYGVEDLDQYGSWSRDESYGPIWRPAQVEADWAPFTRGRWVWQDPWGWTWVDYAPWGWAPSHHGRWVYVQNAWAWAPGPVVARPVYAPATVGFLGVSFNTPSVSVSIGIGPSVGWVPLGYGEPIVPWWGGVGGARRGRPWWGGWGGPHIVNNTVIKNTNVTNINVTNINYTNIDRPRGFTAVSRDSFVRGDMKRIDLPHGPAREFARPLRGAPDVIPQRESLFATRPEKLQGSRGRQPSQEILQRAAVSTRAVPARATFADKVKVIEREKGAPVAPREMQQLARGRSDAAPPQVRTVASRGKRAIVPEVTAQAPARLDAPVQRQARETRPDERRAALPPQSDGAQGGRGKNDVAAPAAPDERRMPASGGASARDAAPPTEPRAARPKSPDASRTERALPPATERAGHNQTAREPVDRGATTPARPQREQAAVQPAPSDAARGRSELPRGNDAKTTPPRASVPRQDRVQRDAGRTNDEQQQRAAQERVRAQAEVQQREQRQQPQRAQRDAATQERAAEQQRGGIQADRQQQRQQSQQAETARRQESARQQRDAAAARRARPAPQQERAVRTQPQPQAVERQAQPAQPQAPPPAGDDRQAKRKEKRQQQPGRSLPDG